MGKRNSKGLRSTAVAGLSAALLAFTQGTAFAASDWGVGPDSALEAGSSFTLYPRALCGSGPCDYDKTWVLSVRAHDDAFFTNEKGSSFALVRGDFGSQVGTCEVTGSTFIFCQVDEGGTVETDDSLTTGSAVTGMVSQSTCTLSVDVTWANLESEESYTQQFTTLGQGCEGSSHSPGGTGN
ncbi:hypothetical protein I5Q34_24995 [Streptomyces sp. AV19]|uniref:hypothetical protein n=1 Tax=Streptomyces sp. AV19 TaxID=2793068 RepID=UPI0018FED64B|nr:hypothetical protein [Streptomyces sp. AV19]MBH1937487.1 hypothetical protein [Streptomyces sp. AV19]MDG4533738.1 hypothetical protein [Streptomyces sp. AV19]